MIKKTVGPKNGFDQEEQVKSKRDSNEKIKYNLKKGRLSENSRTNKGFVKKSRTRKFFVGTSSSQPDMI